MGPLSISVCIPFISNGVLLEPRYWAGSVLTCDKALEEWLLGQIFVVLLEVFLGGGDHLQSNELVSSLLESADNVAD
jgi:hypothetical protein